MIDWLDLLAVQETLKNLLRHHSSNINSSVLSFIYGPTLTSIYDDWRNYSFDYLNRAFQLWEYYQNSLCLQIAPFVTSMLLCFEYCQNEGNLV